MLVEGMGAGDFYILCPDNEVTREVDNRRITWAAQDITQNRPAPSRWHPDDKATFERFLKAGKPSSSAARVAGRTRLPINAWRRPGRSGARIRLPECRRSGPNGLPGPCGR